MAGESMSSNWWLRAAQRNATTAVPASISASGTSRYRIVIMTSMFCFAELLISELAFGHISDRRDHVTSCVVLKRAEAHLNREFAVVFPFRDEFEA